jgi:hypothetical protein
MKGALQIEHLSLRELCVGILEGGGGSFTGDPGGCVNEALEMSMSLHRGPTGNLEGGSYTGDNEI